MSKSIHPQDWHYLGRWVDNVLDTDFWIHWAKTKSIKKITSVRCNLNRLSVDGHFYYWKPTHEALVREGYLAARNGRFSYFTHFCDTTSSVIKRLTTVRNTLAKKQRFSVQDLEIFFREFQELFAPWLAVFPISEGVEKYLGELMKRYGVSLNDIQPLFKPSRVPEINRQLQEVRAFVTYLDRKKALAILKSSSVRRIEKDILQKDPQLTKMIESHLKRFAWIGIHHFWGKPLAKEQLIREMKEEVKKYPFREEKIEKVSIPAELRTYIHTVNQLSYWRFRCAEVTGFVVYAIWNQLHDVAQRIGLPYEDLYWFNRQEILDALKNRRTLDQRIANKRKAMFGYTYIDGKEKIYAEKEAKDLLKIIFKESLAQTKKMIQGTVASRGGILKGKVRIITRPDDVKKFIKGEILVSPETTPDFVPAMKLASAIITDIGGLTSHAAIVAREMKKPCIIGTKVATQVLKDGDLVEVDAERGVVKVLKKA